MRKGRQQTAIITNSIICKIFDFALDFFKKCDIIKSEVTPYMVAAYHANGGNKLVEMG